MDPYKILGIGYDATEEDIKKAYRKLSRKYHPDVNVGNPNQKDYEEKFKEVQQAYSAIMDEKQGRIPSQNGYGGQYSRGAYGDEAFAEFWNEFFGGAMGGRGPQQSREETQEEKYFMSAAQYIRNGYYREGLNVLGQINKEKRTDEWFYYSSFANYKVGNNGIAVEHAKVACALEPQNLIYRRLLDQLTGSETRYQQRSAYYGGNPSMQGSNYCMQVCSTMACASICCSGSGYGLPLLCCF